MIIHKEKVDYVFPDGKRGKKLLVSYVGKNGGIEFLQYPIPKEQMFEWKYGNSRNEDPPFQEYDFEKKCFKVDDKGQPIMRQWRSYDGKPVVRKAVKELPDNRVNELLCSFGKAIDPMFDMNIPTTWFCDIETEVTDEGFPDPEKATTQINTISMTRFPRTIIWSRKNLLKSEIQWVQEQIDVYSQNQCDDPNKKDITKGYKFEFRYFETEKEMLQDYINFITPIEIGAIGGWNFLGFDWLYIYNRCIYNGIDIDRISPTHSHTVFKLTPRAGGATIKVTIPMHKIIYDYMLVFKTWDMTVDHCENYTLDYIAERVLKMRKVEHPWGFKEFFENHFKEYVFYNCIDTILVEQIDKAINTAKIWYMLASLLRIEGNMAFSTIKPTETVMCNFVYPEYKVFPSQKKEFDDDKKYKGAFVVPTVPGVYRYLIGETQRLSRCA